MKAAGADWYICYTCDPHGSEYINAHYREREFLTGFTGSAGTVLIGMDKALLWADGRYHVQAEKETEGSGITVMRMGDPGVDELDEYVRKNVSAGEKIYLYGRLVNAKDGRKLAKAAADAGASLRIGQDLVSAIWTDRPADSAREIRLLPEELRGASCRERLAGIREAMKKAGADTHILSSLDDQMWLFNIRGADIEYCPVAYAYTVIKEDSVILYVKEDAVTEELSDYAWDENIVLRYYEDFFNDLKEQDPSSKVLISPEYTDYLTVRLLEHSSAKLIEAVNPSEKLKAVKTEKEIELIKESYLKDSAVLTSFLKYVKENAGKTPSDEKLLADKLDGMREAMPCCNGLSFSTISAFGPNAAMMHYEATEEDHAAIGENGFYLVDSGGQYEGGTTDVTRTLAIGDVSAELKRDFTRVAAGCLALQNAVFLHGGTGRNLDVLARGPVWELLKDYKCGTGHGIGYMLNVHEGPQGIRWKPLENEAVLEPGMLVSDEPGIYVEGSHGIRTENILLCVEKEKNGDGEFLAFEPLTWVPIDLDAIDVAALEPKERKQLNEYHAEVCKRLSPLMNEEEREWLKKATREV